MADNVQLPVTGTGTADVVAATDDVGGVHYPFLKIADGTLGSTAKIGGDATNGLDVDVTRVQKVGSVVDANNSSTTPLAGDATFTGTATDLTGYSGIMVNVFTDQDGATPSGAIEFSSDGTNWDIDGAYIYVFANTPYILSLPALARYYRVTYTNGSVAQGAFRLQTVLHTHLSDAFYYEAGTVVSLVSVVTQPLIDVRGYDGTTARRLKTDASGELQVDVLTIAAGTNTVGDVGVKPRTSGGFDTFHLASAGTTNATVVKASAGQLFGWYIYNSNASARKVAFHNTASTPTAGASVFFSLVIPGMGGANVMTETGVPFSTGIAITTVTGLADNDSAAVAANDLILNLWYK